MSLNEDVCPVSLNKDGAPMTEARSITTWTKLGAAVRDARVARGMTQSETATKAGVARSWLARVEAGHRGAELESLLKLFASLDLEMALRPARSRSDVERPLTRRELQARRRAQELAHLDAQSAGTIDD